MLGLDHAAAVNVATSAVRRAAIKDSRFTTAKVCTA
jgi:hypothetical protein